MPPRKAVVTRITTQAREFLRQPPSPGETLARILRAGPPPVTPTDLRYIPKVHHHFYLLPQDDALLRRYAAAPGFRSVSHYISCLALALAPTTPEQP